jgi:hypothetical protein
MNPYVAAINDGLEKAREWAATQETLPDDPWALPKDCPLWSMGLSLAQASGILGRLRAERAQEQTGG